MVSIVEGSVFESFSTLFRIDEKNGFIPDTGSELDIA